MRRKIPRVTTCKRNPIAGMCALLTLSLMVASCGNGQDAVSTTASPPTGTRAAESGRSVGDKARSPASDSIAAPQAVAISQTGWVVVNAPNDALLQNLNIPADAPTRGMWSASRPWPLLGAHQAVLPDGKVMTWGTTPDGSSQVGRHIDIWDPDRGLGADTHELTFDATRQDSWCGSANYMGDGLLMLNGGNSSQSIQFYNRASNSLSRGADMAQQRWYGTTVTLANGGAMALGGIDPYTEGQVYDPNNAMNQGVTALTPEVYENGQWRSLFGATSRQAFGPDNLRASYPKAWLAPDGRVFGISSDQMYYVDQNGGENRSGALAFMGEFNPPPQSNATPENAPNVSVSASAVMYSQGRVMVAGGNAWHNGFGSAGSRRATSIDLNGYGAAKTELARMAFNRHWLQLTVLPDGKVLATGGETRANNDPALGVYAAEQWNPANNTWSTLASSSVFRAYHSQASLLANGTVLVTGGGNPGPLQLTGDIFYPPYLFRSVNGVAQLAPRPRMMAISGLRQAHGARMQFDMANNEGITQVALIGLSIGTHSFNAGQRRIALPFTQDAFRITTTIPAAEITPPGYYQVVAVNAAGVPSRGTIIAVGAGVRVPPVPAAPYTPPDTAGAPPSPPPTGPSPVGSSLVLGQTGSLVDASGVVWTFGPNQVSNGDREVLRNGVANGGWANEMRVADSGAVWVRAADGSWWLYSGSTWTWQSTQPNASGSAPPPATVVPPSDAVACATEGNECVLPAFRRATIWYGADNRWTYRTNVAGALFCNNAEFGDPAFGAAKSCRYVVTSTLPTYSAPPPSNSIYCAAELGTCTLPAGTTGTIWFGVGNSWSSRTGMTGATVCNNGVFPDPAPGARKSCRYVVTADSSGTSPTQPLAADTAMKLESINVAGHRVRHSNFQGFIAPINSQSSAIDQNTSGWTVRTGLGNGACWSFESRDWPNHFLRHSGFRVILAARDGTALFNQDATFCARTALSGQAPSGSVSLESLNFPGHFIRHRNFELWVDRNDGSAGFGQDSSFRPSRF